MTSALTISRFSRVVKPALDAVRRHKLWDRSQHVVFTLAFESPERDWTGLDLSWKADSIAGFNPDRACIYTHC